MLDWNRGGYFRVSPRNPKSTVRRYLPGTNVLETRHVTADGVFTVTDLMPVQESSDPENPDRVLQYHQMIRLVRCEAGHVDVVVEFEPRFDFGLTRPRVSQITPNLSVVVGGAEALTLQTDLPMSATSLTGTSAVWRLSSGQEAYLALTQQLPYQLRPRMHERRELELRVEFTTRFWKQWSEICTYRGPYREQVLRSALVLKSLTYASTGAIVAAPTTSLPEEIGGERNWDYRYTWLRDASLTLESMFELGYAGEAKAFWRWMQRAVSIDAADLQVCYGVGGERLLPEFEVLGVDGYMSSKPVRVGNAAAGQFQLDTYGEILSAAWLCSRHGVEFDTDFWSYLVRVAEHVELIWTEPDEGIWEVRGGRRHFVHSKVMAWVAIDRAIRLGRRLNAPADALQRWSRLRAQLRHRIQTAGVDPLSGSFVQSFDSTEVDASSLVFPLVGFIRAEDPRMVATIKRIEQELCTNGLVFRYRNIVDPLVGGENSFTMCSFWLVDALYLSGEVERARELFDRLVGYANDVGLLAEQLDPVTGAQMGNFPQAFSHVGLINSALLLSRGASDHGDRKKGRRLKSASGKAGSSVKTGPARLLTVPVTGPSV